MKRVCYVIGKYLLQHFPFCQPSFTNSVIVLRKRPTTEPVCIFVFIGPIDILVREKSFFFPRNDVSILTLQGYKALKINGIPDIKDKN